MHNDSQSPNPVSEILAILPFYVVYIFLSGWAFDDFYFRSFGVDPKFLDRNFNDTLVKGFTIVFSSWVIVPYALLLLPLFFKSWPRRQWLKMLTTISVALTAAFLVYFISRSAGQRKAQLDRGDKTTLPEITFMVEKQPLVGRLLYIKADSYFVHRVHKQGAESGGELEVSVYRSSEMSKVNITEHE